MYVVLFCEDNGADGVRESAVVSGRGGKLGMGRRLGEARVCCVHLC